MRVARPTIEQEAVHLAGKSAGARWKPMLVALASYVVLTGLFFIRTWVSPTTRVVGARGDFEAYVWFIKWTSFALLHGRNPFFSNYLNWPDGVNLMWNPLMPLPGLVVSPLTELFGPLFAVNVLATAGIALSSFTAFLAVRRYIESWPAAMFGGLLYGFSPYMIAHASGHLDLIWAFVPPLTLLVVDEIVVRRRLSPFVAGGALGVLGAVQLLTWSELLATQAVGVAVVLGVLAWVEREQLSAYVKAHIGRLVRASAAALIVFGVLSAWPLYVLFFGPQTISGAIHPADHYVTDVQNLFVPTGNQLLSTPNAVEVSQRWTGNIAEWNGYLGIPLIILLVAVAFRFRRETTVRVFALSALWMTVISMGPSVHFGGRPITPLASLPLVQSLLPSRLMVLTYLFAAILVGRFIVSLRSVEFIRRAVGFAVMVVVALSLAPKIPHSTASLDIPRFFRGDGVERIPAGTVALVIPMPAHLIGSMAQVWQAESGMRFRMAAEGYAFIPGPDGTARLWPEVGVLTGAIRAIQYGGEVTLTDELRVKSHDELRRWNVRSVIVGPSDRRPELGQLFEFVLGRPAEPVEGVLLWEEVVPSSVRYDPTA